MRTEEEAALFERKMRLEMSDELMHLTDHPRFAELLAYRTALRDYPATDKWPSLFDMPFEKFI